MQGPPTSVPQLLPFVPDPVVLEPPKVQRDLPAPGAVPVALCRRSTPAPWPGNPSRPIRSMYSEPLPMFSRPLEAAPRTRGKKPPVYRRSNLLDQCYQLPLSATPKTPSRPAAALRMSLRHQEIAPDPRVFHMSKSRCDRTPGLGTIRVPLCPDVSLYHSYAVALFPEALRRNNTKDNKGRCAMRFAIAKGGSQCVGASSLKSGTF